ncbi:MAG: transcriptional repressor NrdR [Chloroflexi bacterium]|jgi:transcriptional repressor NrdR|nr:MAG: transcriptional repressor NrdR [Chloroflexota bacterium]TMG07446.1 MAG: transcriptional repressor NrdR [Chloroflexota bacterium]
MNCPFCAQAETKVTDSRPEQDGIRRRRECLACGRRFTTLERVELGGVVLIKKDGRREAFDRVKVIAGMRKACDKRPIPSGAVEALADEVEQAVFAMNRAEVPSSVVGELVMERLKALDHIAYIRFASVYRAFADVDELEQELEALKAGWRRPDIPPDQLALLPDLTPKTASARILRVRRPGGRASARAKTDAEPEKKQQRRAQ